MNYINLQKTNINENIFFFNYTTNICNIIPYNLCKSLIYYEKKINKDFKNKNK